MVLILASTRLGIDIPRCCGVNARLFDIGRDHPGITPRSWHGRPPLRGEGSSSQSAGTRHSHLVTRWCGWLSWVVILGQEPSWRRSQVAAVVPHCGGKARWPGRRPQPFGHPRMRPAVVGCNFDPRLVLASPPSRGCSSVGRPPKWREGSVAW